MTIQPERGVHDGIPQHRHRMHDAGGQQPEAFLIESGCGASVEQCSPTRTNGMISSSCTGEAR